MAEASEAVSGPFLLKTQGHTMDGTEAAALRGEAHLLLFRMNSLVGSRSARIPPPVSWTRSAPVLVRRSIRSQLSTRLFVFFFFFANLAKKRRCQISARGHLEDVNEKQRNSDSSESPWGWGGRDVPGGR